LTGWLPPALRGESWDDELMAAPLAPPSMRGELVLVAR
tara:strand:- start:261 stop:374 length:114 start_codon:yes stop_codon:yes gene_type:complete